MIRIFRLQLVALVALICTSCADLRPPQPLLTVSPTKPVSPTRQVSPLKQVSPLAPASNIPLPAAPSDVPSPLPGKAAISGVLYSFNSSQIVPGTLFYLTKAIGDDKQSMPFVLIGPNDEAGDIRGQSDAKGQFTLNAVPPGSYFLIIWNPPYDWEPGVISGEDHTPRLIQLSADEKKPLGVVYVSWP
jgi:hypothetical protein